MTSTVTQRKKPKSDDEVSSSPARTKRHEEESSISVLRILAIAVLFSFLASYLITNTWTWGYQGKWTNWRRWIPRSELTLTEEELAKCDGSDPDLPIYLAVNGEIFDVSEGAPYYGKGGSYQFFAGKDAARAYTTGCFETHLTHDLRGLTQAQLKDIESWANFYREHAKYFYVGKVVHPPIDPNSPFPPDCHEPKEQKS